MYQAKSVDECKTLMLAHYAEQGDSPSVQVAFFDQFHRHLGKLYLQFKNDEAQIEQVGFYMDNMHRAWEELEQKAPHQDAFACLDMIEKEQDLFACVDEPEQDLFSVLDGEEQ